MTEKTAQQINRMKEQTIGVEVEMNNITRKAAAKLAAEFFGTNRTEYTGSRNGYETYSAWDVRYDVYISFWQDKNFRLMTEAELKA